MRKNPDVVFIGYQQRGKFGPPLALFNVVKEGHKLFKSTISILTVQKERFSYDPYPPFELVETINFLWKEIVK